MPGTLLYSPGLGLAIASAAAVDALRLDLDAEGLAGQLVRVRTGSPQVYYDLNFHPGELPDGVRAQRLGSASVGLRIEGGALVVRDGYDLHTAPQDWDGDEVRWEVPNGTYRLDLAYSWQRQPQADIALHLALVPDDDHEQLSDVDMILPGPVT